MGSHSMLEIIHFLRNEPIPKYIKKIFKLSYFLLLVYANSKRTERRKNNEKRRYSVEASIQVTPYKENVRNL